MSDPSPLISAIVPVFGDWDRLAGCLAALARQTLASDRFEILVVDNEPVRRPETPPLPANARLLHEPRPGSYSARNTAVAAAAGRFLAFTDADCLPEPAWLAAAAARLEAAGGPARVTGPVGIYREAGGGYYPYLYDFHTAFRQRENAVRGVCITANLVVPRAVFDAVGPFNQALFSGGDYEWNRRAQAQGIPLLFDEAVAMRHPARASVRAILRKQRRTGGSGLWGRDVSTSGLLWRALKPPLRALHAFDRAPIRYRDRLPLLGLVWLANGAHNLENARVRLGLGKPRRS